MQVEFFTDPARFAEVAGDDLAARPVVATVVATTAARSADAISRGVAPDPRDWYALVRADDGSIAGVGMNTAPFDRRPLYVLPMGEEAAVAFADAALARDGAVAHVNGMLPAARTVADRVAGAGGRVEAGLWARLFELGELRPPPVPSGRVRNARTDELELCRAWFTAFGLDADEQAGRAPGSHHDTSLSQAAMRQRIDAGCVWLWELDGEVVHLTASSPPAFGVARLGPVYTPSAYRGRGYAGATVAHVSQRLRDGGARVTLFTDQANPVSNRLYERLGYRAVVDQGEFAITTAAPA